MELQNRKATLLQIASSGATRNALTKHVIEALDIELPSLEEQRKLSTPIVNINRQIACLNRTNGYLLECARELFLQDVVRGAPVGKPASLVDIADYRNGLAMQKYRPEGEDPGLPVLKIRELREGRCSNASERCKTSIDDAVKVHDGDVVFSWSGSLLVDLWAGGNAGLNQHLFKVTSKRYPKWFYFLWTDYYLPRFVAMAADRATTMGHIKRSALEGARVTIPADDDLIRIGSILGPITDRIVLNKVGARRLEQLRDTLLPKLMSGEIDVSKVELPGLG